MISNHETVKRWVDRVLSDDPNNMPFGRSENVFSDEDKLFSYGYHFELARLVRDKKGKPKFFLLNGDRYSVSTSQHQSHVRGVVRRAGIPVVIIPHSALDAANIVRDSIEIVDVSEDHTEVTTHTSHSTDGMKWHPEAVIGGGGYWTMDGHYVTVSNTPHPFLPGHGVTYTWETRRHWLGESLIRAKSSHRQLVGGEYRWSERTSYYLSGFDHQERTPLYFFCELPRVKKADQPTTIAEAYELLKPQPVLLAEENGRTVVRQGDIFGVELEQGRKDLTAAGATFEKRGNLLNTNHEATEVAYLPNGAVLARGMLYHNPDFRAPDHARRKLGDGKKWFAIAKNRVPVAA